MPNSVATSNSSSADSIVAQECNNVSRRLTKSDNNLTAVETKKGSTAETASITYPSDGRETWGKKVEFLLAVIGFAVDLGNVWRFPSTCYMNGAFLVPYCIMLIFGGLPLFYMELALGQYFRSGCLTVWRRVCPALKGIGYAICIIDLYVGMHYNTIIAWAVYYLGVSMSGELPWLRCNNSWNTLNCSEMNTMMELNGTNTTFPSSTPAQEYYEREVLEQYRADGISNIGEVKLSIAFCLLIVFILVYFSLWKGVKSTGKAVWFTALAPYVVLFILLIRGLTLPGADIGISYYLTPNWRKLQTPKVWIDAAIQIFFSLGPGFGTLLALSSYNKFNNNCYRDAILTSTINCATSFLAGFVVFSVLGYMAQIQNKAIDDLGIEGFGLVFIVYPAALATMPYSNFWSIIFFLMLITLGLDSTFGGLEAVITALCDEYPRVLRRHREVFVAGLIAFLFICSLPTCTYGGTYVVNLITIYGPGISTLFIVFLEAVGVAWLYGVDRFSRDIEKMIGKRPSTFWTICWMYSPIFILILFISSIVLYDDDLSLKSYTYPRWSINVGLVLTASSLVCIPLYMIYLFFMTTGTFWQRIQKMVKPMDTSEIMVNNPAQNYGTTV